VSIKIKNPRRNKLYNDGERKECGRCHKIKSHEYFTKRQGRLHSVCEKCRQIIQGINNFKKQIKVITDLFEKRCHNCHTGFQILPAMQFHHINSRSKNYTWRTLRGRNIDEIIRILKKENLKVLCKNCHTCVEVSNFDKFRDIVLSEKLSINNIGELDGVIYNEIKSNIKYKSDYRKGAQHRARIKYRIKKWIKKRLVIEILYNGACIGCEDININDKLPALEFHHRNPKKKEFKWENLSKLPINKIIIILKNEDCVCLCKNCHSLIHSVNFEQFYKEIFERDTSLINLVEEKYLILKENINNFSFKNNNKIKM
jgi:uncharacterized protein YqgV (UPF0045/DUF77 family)